MAEPVKSDVNSRQSSRWVQRAVVGYVAELRRPRAVERTQRGRAATFTFGRLRTG